MANAKIKTSEIKRLCALQCTDEEICAYFNISRKTWLRVQEQEPGVREAVAAGRADGKISLRRKQMVLAGGNAAMAIHLGKVILGQEDKSKLEVSGPNGGPMEMQYDFSKLTPDEKEALQATLAKAVRG